MEPALDQYGLVHHADIPAERCSADEHQFAALVRGAASGHPLWLFNDATQGQLAESLRDHAVAAGPALIAIHGSLDSPPAAAVSLSTSGPDR